MSHEIYHTPNAHQHRQCDYDRHTITLGQSMSFFLSPPPPSLSLPLSTTCAGSKEGSICQSGGRWCRIAGITEK